MSLPCELSIIVVSYNTKAMTLACLDAIARETRTRYELIVVDNASRDGSPEAIAAHPAVTRFIPQASNIGFARANNLAAREAGGRLILLLNPDTVVSDRAIDRLVAVARARPEARLWGGRTLFEDGRLNAASCWAAPTAWSLFCRASGLAAVLPSSKLFNPEAYGGWPRDGVREVEIVSGCFLLIERDLWRALDGFDPAFFMYGEDADLCLRAARHGARPMITPEATIVHHGGASERSAAGKLVKLLAAKARLIDRHWPPYRRPLGHVLLAAWPLSRLVALSIAERLGVAGRQSGRAAVWAEVWRSRARWRDGWSEFAENTAPAAVPTAAAS